MPVLKTKTKTKSKATPRVAKKKVGSKSVAKKPTGKKRGRPRKIAVKTQDLPLVDKNEDFLFDELSDMDLDFAFSDPSLQESIELPKDELHEVEHVSVLHSSRFTFYLGMLLGMMLLSASLIFSFSIAMYQTSDGYLSRMAIQEYSFDLLGRR